MEKNDPQSQFEERRAEERKPVVSYASVEFFQEGLKFPYQFKIRNLTTKGMCILVKEDSDVLEYLKVGRKYEMKYYSDAASADGDRLYTEVVHMTQDEFKGHVLIGLAFVQQ